MTIKEKFQKFFKKKEPLLYEVSDDIGLIEDDTIKAVIEKSAEIADFEEDLEDDFDLEEEFEILDDHGDYLQDKFEKETGKHAVWSGKITKGFLKWKENHNS